MADSVNDILMDRAVRHQIGLQRYSTSTVRKILRLLSKTEQDIVNKLMTGSGGAGTEIGRARLEAMLAQIRETIQEGYNQLYPAMHSEMMQLASYEVEFSTKALQTTLPIKIDIVTPTDATLAAAVNSRPFQGRILREWAQSLRDDAFRRVRDAVRIGWAEGETIDQIVRRVRGTRARGFKDGILEINRRNAEAVVRTAVNHTASAARDDLYSANDDLVKAVVWVSTLDTKTTPICRARDGKVYEVGKGPRPPAHYNCRSSTAPVIKSWRELGIDLDEAPAGTRAAMNGQVPAETTYGEWLRRQDRETVEDVLGKKKAKLFLDGDLSVDRFVDDRGKELTLDQLRRREAAAFERAGLDA